jgi:NADP-dependent 3-hydroxy acid dehydrogenase YdfG
MVRTDRNPMVGRPERDALNPEDVAAAVAYLESQSERAWSHELVMTPVGDTWVP